MTADTLGPLLAPILGPLLVALLLPVVAWVVARLPGPIRDYLYSAVHARDVALLTDALTRRAVAIASGQVHVTSPPLDLAAYARQALPEVLAKLAPTEEALRTLALAALARAAAETSTNATRAPGLPIP